MYRNPIQTGALALLLFVAAAPCVGQSPELRFGETVPRDVREMYDRGLRYLAESQEEDGGWSGGQQGPGVDGLCVVAFLASGEDPNFGIYSNQIRKGLRKIIQSQDANTGYMGPSMYHHGFGMLALAEAYGAVDDRNLWQAGDADAKRSIGEALELAVRLAITSQKKNPLGAWRYSPEASDADTSVSGSILVGLLAARNAGIEVPDESIDRAISYFKSMTADSGQVAYAGGIGGLNESLARISIATLVFAVGRRHDLTQYAAAKTYLTQHLDASGGHYKEYTLYYQAQALFQGDAETWDKWNKLLIRKLKAEQRENGSFDGSFGTPVATSMSLLALALNYRFLPIYER
ncbi:squalene--hopene cyclase [Blastopirellula sp. JC732]|uniref:Squalene--hopene cyclase n=1 Tax=Blastopirellula sediminis TaxID=2894196 RepID=A0A9X1MHD1_9BACT|nr:squalene--hopene cyclase [Blastopirellula sediminis]MCC9608069.1 squalene--hopene cyclase [Blastopirellula sediminis]MCC9627138.1 squalene--hopene cyclase [Blastopirellula sediminis]